MTHSLFARLLILSVIVALGASAATAWLTAQSTAERLRREFEQMTNVEVHISNVLFGYAETHASWDDVDETLARLERDLGHRVALTAEDGELLADSAGEAADRPALPEARTTSIDVLSGMVVGVDAASETFASPHLSRGNENRASDTYQVAAAAATECVQRSGLRDTAITATSTGRSFVVTPDEAYDLQSAQVPAAVSACIFDDLWEASAAGTERHRLETTLFATCLDREGVPYRMDVDGFGSAEAVPEPGGAAAVDRCARAAWSEAAERFVAEPADVYIGSSDRYDAIAGDRLWRIGLTVLAVLVVMSAVAAVAARRLTGPVRSLTQAVRRMASGDRAARTEATGFGEVAELGNAFNEMAETIERNEQQRKTLVSDVAHELRSPLTNIRGYLEAAADRVVPLNPELVDALLADANILQRLIDDLQDLALADAGALRLQPRECDAAELVRQVVASCSGRAEGKDVELVVEAPEPVALYADPTRLRQALANVVDNALDHTPAGGTIHVDVDRTETGVAFAVRDTGPGIAAEHLPHLFDRFYRADPSRSRTTGGSGLGLAIVKQTAEAMGGIVRAASVPGRGATFTIMLPAGAARSTDDDRAVRR